MSDNQRNVLAAMKMEPERPLYYWSGLFAQAHVEWAGEDRPGVTISSEEFKELYREGYVTLRTMGWPYNEYCLTKKGRSAA